MVFAGKWCQGVCWEVMPWCSLQSDTKVFTEWLPVFGKSILFCWSWRHCSAFKSQEIPPQQHSDRFEKTRIVRRTWCLCGCVWLRWLTGCIFYCFQTSWNHASVTGTWILVTSWWRQTCLAASVTWAMLWKSLAPSTSTMGRSSTLRPSPSMMWVSVPVRVEFTCCCHVLTIPVNGLVVLYCNKLTNYYNLYTFFWVITRFLDFICRRFGTLCLFHLHFFFSYPSFILLTSTRQWRWNRHSVPKRRHINSRRRVITQKKPYNIQNMAKAWN